MAEAWGNLGARPKPPFFMSNSWVMESTWAATTPGSNSAAPVKTSACAFGERFGGAFQLGALIAEGIGDGEKHAAETGTVHLVFGREIGAAEKRLAVGEKESGERPAALFGNRADGGLVAGIHIGTLVAVDFDGHEIVVDDFRDFGILVTFAVDDVAPVAPDSANVEEDGFVFRLGASKSGIVPFVPVNRLV